MPIFSFYPEPSRDVQRQLTAKLLQGRAATVHDAIVIHLSLFIAEAPATPSIVVHTSSKSLINIRSNNNNCIN
jgi:hypothetical protein